MKKDKFIGKFKKKKPKKYIAGTMTVTKKMLRDRNFEEELKEEINAITELLNA